MARIRTIKPDFWDSADTARASLRTRLLYIAMWNWADDYGIGDGHPGRIITFAFPNDDIPAADYPRLLADVSDAFGVVFFDHLERPYYTVPAWDKHQRTEKKAKAKDGLLEAAAAAVESDVVARQERNAELPRNVADSPTLGGEPSDAGSRKWEREREDKEPPYPPSVETEPGTTLLPARKTGTDKALARIGNAPFASVPARQIAHAYNRSLNQPLTAKILGEVAVVIDECLQAEISPDAIAAGIREWTRSDSWAPSQIPNFVHKANNRNTQPRHGVGKATEKALGYEDIAQQIIAELEATA